MRSLRTLAAAVTVAATAVLAMPAVAAGAATTKTTFFEHSRGANVIFSPNCPFGDWLPSVDTVCDTYTVWYVSADQRIDGSAPAPTVLAFHAEIDHETDLVHPDGTGFTLAYEAGIAPVDGYFDPALRSAHMAAVLVPLQGVDLDTGEMTPNGRTAHLGPFAWTAASPTYVWHKNPPALSGPRHLRTPCQRTDQRADQQDTVGYVTGSVDGVSIAEDYQLVQIPGLSPADGTGYIFDNTFHFTTRTKC